MGFMFEPGLRSLLNCAGAVSLVYLASCWLFAEELEIRFRDRFPQGKS